ncbi:MAG: hypothetical protein ACOZNI_34985 [Myxococcota bacterium]
MNHTTLRLRRLGIDTYRQPVVYMRADCPVCRAEGFEAQAMVEVHAGGHVVVAVLNVVTSKLAGAPLAAAAGLVFHAPVGTVVVAGQPLYTLHAETPGELAYAHAYAVTNPDLVEVA